MRTVERESQIDEAVRRRVKKYRQFGVSLYAVKTISQGRQRKGLPDWHVTYRGQSFWIENKRPGNQPTPLQRAELARWAAAGAITGFATSADEFFAILHRFAPLPDLRG